jgi:acyl-CoA thioester hydrolase
MATTQKIRYSDCDPQGIVFNGNYGRYWDDAVTDWLEDAGFGGLDMGGTGADMVAARIEIDFRNAATLGDVIETTVEVERLGTTSMTLAITTRRRSDGTVVVEGREVIVFIDPASFEPTPIPGPIRAALT